ARIPASACTVGELAGRCALSSSAFARDSANCGGDFVKLCTCFPVCSGPRCSEAGTVSVLDRGGPAKCAAKIKLTAERVTPFRNDLGPGCEGPFGTVCRSTSARELA